MTLTSPDPGEPNTRGVGGNMSSGRSWLAYASSGAVLAAALAAFAGSAQAQDSTGVLRCDVSGGIGLVFGSSRELQCTYTGNDGRTQYYNGEIKKFGIDIGFTKSGVIIWGVLAPNVNMAPGALSGTYAGVSAQAAAVRGVGANALVSTNKIMLNPLSVEGVKGVNIAAGVTGLNLDYVADPSGRTRYPIGMPPGVSDPYGPAPPPSPGMDDPYPVVPPPG